MPDFDNKVEQPGRPSNMLKEDSSIMLFELCVVPKRRSRSVVFVSEATP